MTKLMQKTGGRFFVGRDNGAKGRELVEALKSHLTSLDEAIAYTELTDTAYLRHYTYLVRQRRILAKAISKLGKLKG